jgi:hypothetical protein
MAGKNAAVFGIYTTRRGVENAVDSLFLFFLMLGVSRPTLTRHSNL